MRYIPITVNNEYIRGVGAVVGAAGAHKDSVMDITFGPAWTDKTKSIVWRDARHGNSVVTLLTNTYLKPGTLNEFLVPIPAEPMAYAGKMTMTIKGATVEDETETSAILTAYGEFVVLESLWDADAEASDDVTPTKAEQLQAAIDNATTRLNVAEPKIDAVYDMEVSAESIAPGLPASVTKEIQDGIMHMDFGIPIGETGPKGEKGDPGRAVPGWDPDVIPDDTIVGRTYAFGVNNGELYLEDNESPAVVVKVMTLTEKHVWAEEE